MTEDIDPQRTGLMSDRAEDPQAFGQGTAESQAKGARPRISPWLLGIWRAVLLVLILGAALAFVVGTPAGLRLGLALAQSLLPLSVGGAEGRWLDRLRLTEVALTLPGLDLRLRELALDWRPAELLQGRLVIARLALQGVEVRLPPPSQEGASSGPPAIRWPLAVEVGEVALDDLRLMQGDRPEPIFVLAGTKWNGASLRQGVLDLGRLEARLGEPDLQLGLAGRIALTGDYPLDLDLDWALALASGEGLSGKGRADGDLRHLVLTQTLAGAVAGQFAIELRDLSLDPSWDARVRIERVAAPVLQPFSPRGELASSGRLQDARLSGRIEFDLPLGPEVSMAVIDLDARWAQDRLLLDRLRLAASGTETEVLASGRLDLGRSPLALKLDGTWQGLSWPPGEGAIARSPEGTFSLEGGLDGLAYRLRGPLAGPEMPASEVELAGRGDLSGAHIERLVIRLLDGRLEGRGSIAWSPDLSWELSAEVTDINPGTQLPDWPGRLAGRLSGQGGAGRWEIALAELKGELRGYPFSAQGGLLVQGDGGIELRGFRLDSGPNRLALSGRFGEELDLALDLDAPELKGLWPQAGGRLKLSGRLTGSRRSPALQAELKGEGIRWGEQGLSDLEGRAQLVSIPDGRLALQLEGRALQLGTLSWDSFKLSALGTVATHRLEVSLRGRPLNLRLEGQGALNGEGRYRAEIRRLELVHQDLGRWSLQRPLILSSDGARIAVGPLCLREVKGSAGCASLDHQASGRWTLGFDLERMDLALFKGWLPDRLDADGLIRAQGRVESAGGRLSAELGASIPRGRLRVDLGKGQVEQLDLANSRLDLRSGQAGVEGRLELLLGRLGRIQAEVGLTGGQSALGSSALRGRLLAELMGLAPFGALVEEINSLQGSLRADLSLGGTLERPSLSGQAWLRDLRFQLPMLGLRLEDLDLEATAAQGGQLDLWGQARLGGGLLRLSGQGQARAERPWVRLGIEGERIKIADTREYLVFVEPELVLGLDPAGAVIQGRVSIPEARIRPRELPPGAVSPSPDVVLMRERARTPLPLRLDVRVVLGDAVQMDGFGLRGRLAGELRLLKEPGRELLGDGQIQILEGQYRLTHRLGIPAEVGSPLSITQGRLVFARSPLANPGLWIQAERQGGDLTAGVRVVGTLREPKLTFFSESDPALTQSEITKYLMTGIPPSANDRAEGTGLAIGTYLAPQLYMEYGSGLGGDSSRFRLRYDLSRHIELQAETGARQGADLFFKFEH